MATWSSDRYRGGSSSASSAYMRRPNENNALTARAAIAFVLTIVCAPLGILYMWRAGVFRVRGRVLMTLIGAVVMVFVFSLASPETEAQPVLPTASKPQAIALVSEDESATALSNMDQLLGLAPAPDAAVPVPAEGAVDPAAQQPVQDDQAAQEAELLNTTVYAVYNGAQNYHTEGTCGTQTNRRQLTIQEALDEGLTPCTRCNPPAP